MVFGGYSCSVGHFGSGFGSLLGLRIFCHQSKQPPRAGIPMAIYAQQGVDGHVGVCGTIINNSDGITDIMLAPLSW